MTKRNLNSFLQYVLVIDVKDYLADGLDFYDICWNLCKHDFIQNANGHPSRIPDPDDEHYSIIRVFLAKNVIIQDAEELIQTMLENMVDRANETA